MHNHLRRIFDATSTNEVCSSLQNSINELKYLNYFNGFPEGYASLSAKNPLEIQNWFDLLKNEKQAEEEGNLREIRDLFQATIIKLREFGFHR